MRGWCAALGWSINQALTPAIRAVRWAVESSDHAAPSGDCIFCCEDFTQDNYVEYQAVEGGAWMKSPYCKDCIEHNFIDKQVATLHGRMLSPRRSTAALLLSLLTALSCPFACCRFAVLVGEVFGEHREG